MTSNRRAFTFRTSVVAAQMPAAMTIVTRMPMLFDTSSPAARGRAERETHAMVAEKAEAITEDARREMLAAVRLGSKGGTHPATFADASAPIDGERYEPARRMVRQRPATDRTPTANSMV